MTHQLRAWALAACFALIAVTHWSSVSYAETVIGNWEAGASDGWIDWGLGQSPINVPILPGRWAFNSVGATSGSGAVQFHSDGGYWQHLSIKLQLGDPPGSMGSNGIDEFRDEFMANSKLAFDLTFVEGEFGVGNDFVTNNLIFNADGYGFQEQDGTAADRPLPESIEPFVGQNGGGAEPIYSFNPTLLVGTQTSTWVYDIGYLHDGVAANGEMTVNPDTGFPNFVEIIFVQYSNAAATIHIDNVRMFTPVVARPGDYNADDVVDAADYTVWRNNLGTNFDLNGNGDETGGSAGVVNEADYAWWMQHYGLPMMGGGGVASDGGQLVPEPASFVLGLLTLAMSAAICRRRVS